MLSLCKENGGINVVDRPSVHTYPPKTSVSSVTGKITSLRISKSLIRQLIYKGEPYPVCPNKVYHTLLLRDIVNPPSEAQMKGLYFESQCLGSTVEGALVDDLPRHKKTGEKLKDHERIDQAVELFASVKEDLGLVVDDSRIQQYHRRKWKDPSINWDIDIFLDGTMDLLSPIQTNSYQHEEATVDLKLTRDRDMLTVFSNGLFHSTPWGNMQQADFTEPMLYRLIFGKPFIYLVFDYKATDAGYRDIPIITDVNDPDPQKAATASERMADLIKTIRWTISSIMQWEKDGWPMTPIPKVCQCCPIEDCSLRNQKNEV
jgi:hypothetical protein